MIQKYAEFEDEIKKAKLRRQAIKDSKPSWIKIVKPENPKDNYFPKERPYDLLFTCGKYIFALTFQNSFSKISLHDYYKEHFSKKEKGELKTLYQGKIYLVPVKLINTVFDFLEKNFVLIGHHNQATPENVKKIVGLKEELKRNLPHEPYINLYVWKKSSIFFIKNLEKLV